MEADIEEARAEEMNVLQTQKSAQDHQQLMDPTSDTFMSQSVFLDVKESGNPDDSFACVDMCPDVRYLNEHLVTPGDSSSTSQYIDPMCDVLMSQSAYQDHTGLAKSQVSFGGVDYYPDVNPPSEHLVNANDSHMNLHLIEPVCDVFMSQNTYQANNSADNFPDLQYLEKHLVTQTNEPTLSSLKYRWHECQKCHKCIEGFVHDHELAAHMLMTHAENNQLGPNYFETEEYPLNFQDVMSIEEPVTLHTEEKPHQCSVCGIGFRQSSVLEQHMFLHNTDIPNTPIRHKKHVHSKAAKKKYFECSDCGMNFNTRKCLKRHKQSHTKKKRYKCSVCGEKFRYSYLWTNHVLIHTEKSHIQSHKETYPYKCSVCNKGFRYCYLWTNHVLTHTEESPCKCKVCNKRLPSASSLERHMMTHRGGKPHTKNKKRYACKACNKKFERSSQLRRHVKNKHSITPETAPTPKPVQYKWDECHNCCQCIEGFTNECELTEHMVTHKVDQHQRPSDRRKSGQASNFQKTSKTKEYMANTKPHKCSVCGIRFRQLSVYQQHLLLHKTDIPRVSAQYGNDLILPRDFREHQDIKVMKKKHLKCSYCKSKFSKQKHLKVHMKTHKGQRLYKCSSCREEFSHLADLKKHVTTHSGDKLYMCSLCNKKYKHSASLKLHMVVHKGGKTYKCSVCSKNFSSSSHMKKHVLREHSVVQTKELPTIPQYRWDECHMCSQCITGFTSDDELTAHMASHKVESPSQPCLQKGLSKKKSHECSHCSKVFLKRKYLKQHMATHSRVRPYKCLVCNKGFTQSSSLDEHMLTHTAEKPHKCSVCSKRFRRSKSLRSHMRCHIIIRSELKQSRNMLDRSGDPKRGADLENKSLKCHVCGLLFSCLSELKKHKKAHKVARQRLQQCSVCKMSFTRSSSLNHRPIDMSIDTVASQDVDQDSGELQNCVDGCGSGSTKEDTNIDLQTHMDKVSASSSDYDRQSTGKGMIGLKDPMTHSELHECPVCGMGFRIISELGSHMMLHTTRNPLMCCVCNKGFNQLANLRLHMRIHTGEKPHKCSLCKRCFRTPSNLREHMMIHTGKKPYRCSVCNKGFIRSVQFRRHIKTHTANNADMYSACSETVEQYNHSNTHSDLMQHYCTLCNRSFMKFSNFVCHMEMHTRVKRKEIGKKMRKTPQAYNCDQCKKMLKTQAVFDRHTTKWPCIVCEQSFCRLSYLNNHMKTHNGENLNDSKKSSADTSVHAENKTCYICSMQFETVSAFSSHMKCHARPKSHMCYVCNRSFRQLLGCQKHMMCITRKRPFHCPFCNKKYLRLSIFRKHVKTHTNRTAHACIHCVELFSSQESLLAHRCYPEGNEYRCCHCQKSFTSLSSLKEHVSAIQIGTEMYVCIQCNKWFPRQDDLVRHKFSHTKWGCSDCQVRYSVKKSLEEHLYTHLSDWTKEVYICSVCKKGFTAWLDFKDHRHLLTHTDSTECGNCVRGFLQQTDLESHLVLHNDIDSSL